MKLKHLLLQLATKVSLRSISSKKGQTLVEYSIILGLVSTLVITSLIGLGQRIDGVYSLVNSNVYAPTQSSFAAH